MFLCNCSCEKSMNGIEKNAAKIFADIFYTDRRWHTGKALHPSDVRPPDFELHRKLIYFVHED